ncbi:MAG: hypothetical protein R3E39_08195 [Anaerolineae bacterium]
MTKAERLETTDMAEAASQIKPPPAEQSDDKKLKAYHTLVKAIENK